MVASKVLLVCLQALLIAAQTPPDFKPAVTAPLQVKYGASELSPAGKKVERPGMLFFPPIMS
jgi:hypothetical protein